MSAGVGVSRTSLKGYNNTEEAGGFRGWVKRIKYQKTTLYPCLLKRLKAQSTDFNRDTSIQYAGSVLALILTSWGTSHYVTIHIKYSFNNVIIKFSVSTVSSVFSGAAIPVLKLL